MLRLESAVLPAVLPALQMSMIRRHPFPVEPPACPPDRMEIHNRGAMLQEPLPTGRMDPTDLTDPIVTLRLLPILLLPIRQIFQLRQLPPTPPLSSPPVIVPPLLFKANT